MQMIKDEIRYTKAELAGGTGLGMVTLLAIVALLWLQGCAGMEAGVFVRRHDTITDNKTTVDKPIKCFFTDCGGK